MPLPPRLIAPASRATVRWATSFFVAALLAPSAGAQSPWSVTIAPNWALVGPSGSTRNAGSSFATTFGMTGLGGGVASKDRPIGITLRAGGYELPRRAIVLTREILEAILPPPAPPVDPLMAALAAASATRNDLLQAIADMQSSTGSSAASSPPPAGTIAVLLIDGPGPNLKGHYILYLRVERR
ncbi:MAG: hypothetical protein ABI601_07025 [bacterium]